MGTPAFSVPTLRALHEAGHEIVAVYTRAPAASGRRGKQLRPSPVHAAADELGIEVRTPRTLRTDEEVDRFHALNAEAAIVIAYGRILPLAILNAVPLGCWNVHASLLPRWRGAAPIQRAIMAGDDETGVQVMRMEEGLDTGPIALTHREPIGPTTTAGDLFETLANHAAELMVEAVARLADGTLAVEPQSEDGVTYADKIEKDEARIDWSCPADQVARHINGLSPFPGAWTVLGNDRVKLLRARSYPSEGSTVRNRAGTESYDMPPANGEARSITTRTSSNDPDLRIACGSGTVSVLEAQRAGSRATSGNEFARSLSDGARFE